MTRTISRTRLQRGTQPTRTRDVVPGDAVAPRRRRLSGAGPDRPNPPRDPAEPRQRPLARADDPDRAAMPRARTERQPAPRRKRARDEETPKRRARTAAIGSLEPGREGVAASLDNTDVRGPSTGGRAARERSKIASIRDGRYGRTRARFIV